MASPTSEEFSWFYTLGDQGFYYFAKWATKGVQSVTKIKESFGN